MKKTILILLLVLCLVLPTAPYAAATSPTEAEVYEAMNALRDQYPEGTPWGQDKFYAWNGGIYAGGYGCVAFAFILSDAAFGTLPARKSTEVVFSQVRPGDILRMENDTHSVIVLETYEDYVVIAEGSYNNSVHWGRVLSATQVEGSNYVMTRYPEDAGSDSDTPTLPPAADILASGNCGDLGQPNVKWALATDGTLYLYGIGQMDTYSYAQSTPWASYLSSITSVLVGNGVTNLGSHCFTGCTSLKSVTLADSVTTLGTDVFSGCTSLSSVTLGSGLTTIGSRVFQGCTALRSITLPASLTKINIYAFSRSGLEQVSLPQGLTYLGTNAFEQCDALVSANLPGSIQNNLQYIFYGCDRLSSVTLGSGLTEIGAYTFAECPALKSITFPATMVEIGERAYSNSGLETLTLPGSITTLGDYAFNGCPALKSVTLPGSVTEFGNYVFSYCEALQTVRVAEGAATLGKSTFLYCKSLTDVSLPGSLTTIEVYTFANSGLTHIDLPEGIKTIAKFAFEYAEDLKSIGLPATLTSIGNNAFDRCESLTDVYFYGTQSQWNSVSIASGNYSLDYAMLHIVDPNACTHRETVTIPAVAPSCESSGLTAGKRCANASCGQILTAQQYVAPTGHSWKNATCTEPKTCRTCGATQGSATGHSWKNATCTEPKTCRTCGATQGSATGHSWKNATCTEPKTCRTCGTTEGKPNGHTSDGQNDCRKESTCKICGVTLRAPGEHAWNQGQILTAPTCTVSGKAHFTCLGCGLTTDGDVAPLGHDWQAATCTAPRTCSRCSASEAGLAAHADSNADGKCDSCGTAVALPPTEPIPTEPAPTVPDETAPTQPEATVPETSAPTQPSVPQETQTQPSAPTEQNTVPQQTTRPDTPQQPEDPTPDASRTIIIILGALVATLAAVVVLLIVLNKKKRHPQDDPS